MIKRLAIFFGLFWGVLLGSFPVFSQTELGAIARVIADKSVIQDRGFAKPVLQIGLSQGVPYRIFTLTAPKRLVIEFNAVEFTALSAADFDQSNSVAQVRFGQMETGWSRMVLDLTRPLTVDTAQMSIQPIDQSAILEIHFRDITVDEFQKTAGAPEGQQISKLPTTSLSRKPDRGDDVFVVALDAGHGGIDPGAQVGKVSEADLMLALVRRLRDRFRAIDGIEVVMTRDGDVFIPLEQRIEKAHSNGADVFISLHADIVTEGRASGATVYTLAQTATDDASEKLALRHDRAEILSGVDLRGADDEVAGILMDLARQETQPRSIALAKSLVHQFDQTLDHVNSRPHRGADFSVLKAADIPSVLIEAGFMSSRKDLKNLQNKDWLERFSQAVVAAVVEWKAQDNRLSKLRRQ